MKTAGHEKVESVEKELSDLSIGQKLRKFREATGLNCAEFAKKLGVSADVITSLESDEVELTVKMLVKVAETFGVLGVGMFLASSIILKSLAGSQSDEKDTDAADMETVAYERRESAESILSELAKLLRKARDVSGCGLPEFAKKIGISAMRLARFENGLDDVALGMLVKAYKVAGLPKDDLKKYLGEFSSKQEKLNWFLEQVKGCMDVYCPPYQREVILFITKGRKHAENPSGDIDYLIEKIEKMFIGCEVAFRNKVLSAYLDNVLPSLQAEYDKEVAIDDATNDLLALTNGKTVQQIKTMIKVLKMNNTPRKYKKVS